MISPKKIHQWIIRALEEPFLRAEMHQVDMLLTEHKETERLHLIEGGKKKGARKSAVELDKVGKYVART